MSAARILNILDMVPNKRGPVEQQLTETARQATARGSRFAAYFTGPAPDWYAEEMSAAGGEIGFFDRSAWPTEVVALCRTQRPDVAHFHFGPHAGMNEVSQLGIRVVRSEHSFSYPRSLEPARAVVRHQRTRRVDRFVAVSEFIARQTVRRYLVPRSRVRVILNGTDLQRFRPMPEDKQRLRRELLGLSDEHVVITLAAFLGPAKRQAMAVLAMPEILQHAPHARLILAGDGPQRQALQALIAANGLADSIQLLSSDNDVAKIYAASDLALQPTMGEGLGGAAIEALACGLPLIATPNGGIVEVYEDGVSGVSVHDQTSHGLAASALALIEDATKREQMGRSARARAETLFAIERPAAQTLAAYDELV